MALFKQTYESKTKFMVYSISSRSDNFPRNLEVKLNNQPIERVQNYKFLGLNINQHLSWKAHMLDVLSKIQRNLAIVRKIARFLDRNSLLQLYHSLIMSHIRNGIVVWHHSHISIRKKIQACANKFLRTIFFLKPRDSVKTIMKDNGLLSVNQIHHLEVAKVMQRHALKSIPLPFTEIFKKLTRTSTTSTRSGTNFIQAASSTSKCAQSIRCSGPKIWNSIPREIRFIIPQGDASSHLEVRKLTSFKIKLKKFVLDEVNFI